MTTSCSIPMLVLEYWLALSYSPAYFLTYPPFPPLPSQSYKPFIFLTLGNVSMATSCRILIIILEYWLLGVRYFPSVCLYIQVCPRAAAQGSLAKYDSAVYPISWKGLDTNFKQSVKIYACAPRHWCCITLRQISLGASQWSVQLNIAYWYWSSLQSSWIACEWVSLECSQGVVKSHMCRLSHILRGMTLDTESGKEMSLILTYSFTVIIACWENDDSCDWSCQKEEQQKDFTNTRTFVILWKLRGTHWQSGTSQALTCVISHWWLFFLLE